MPQIINTNIASLNAQRNLNKSQAANQTALQRLSSGLRINSAKDDAAGLAISTRFNSQIRGLNVAVRNAGDGISLAQTAEGALGSMNDNLQRIRELAVQSANATNSDVDRDALQSEVSQLLAEVSRTADETDFNGRKLLDGSFSATFQIGANAGQTLDVSISELTAEKLGSASTAGISANGNANALANGDLIINGIAIAASKAGDDTSSTDNAGASAIAKAEAINRHTGETGVSATVNDNVVSGSEMTGAAFTGDLTLNGVAISLTTTTSTSGTRAAVAEAINAVSTQTGIRAVNTDADTGGVQLIAEDGRNIQISFGGTLTAAATGVAAAATYEGGYTLVADAAVGEVIIDGGNGTGKGDLSNAGLTKGTYDRGVAASVTDGQNSSLTRTSVTGGSLANDITNTTDNATLLGGNLANTKVTSAAALTAVSETHTFAVNVVTAAGSATTMISITSSSDLNDVVSALDQVAGVDAFERITFSATDYDAAAGGSSLYLANQTIALADDALAPYDTVSERLTYLTDTINNTTFSAGVTVTAELNQAKTAVVIQIDNRNTAGYLAIGVSTGATLTNAAFGALAAGSAGLDEPILGDIAFTVSGATLSVGLDITEATAGAGASNDLYQGKTFTSRDHGSTAFSTTSTNELNVSLDGTVLTAQTLAAGSTVNDLAVAVNAYTDINAWEEITLTFDANNFDVGDSFKLGDASLDLTSAANGVAVAISGTTLADVVDDFNTTDFSSAAIDISAELNAAGTSFTLTIRNFSGTEIGAVVNGEGRSLQQTGGNLIGSVQQSLSGVLAYASESGEPIDITIADPSVGGEFFAGNSDISTFAGVNGLADGDIIINGVSIGAAQTDADTSSAEFASDNTKILSSTKELSAISVAASINSVSSETGVSATINATEVVGGDGTNNTVALQAQFAIGDSSEIFINGYSAGTVTLQDDGSGSVDTDRAKSDALSIINSITGKTGVSAIDNGVSLTMTAADGRNVSIAVDDKSGADASMGALFGLDAAVAGIGESSFGQEVATASANAGISAESATYETTYGTVTLESAGEFTIAAGANGADELTAVGLTEGSYGGAVDGQFLTEIDISTFEGATSALTAIDNAIGAIASQRAVLGAIQNRMESTVSNLAITSENLAAANSRIQDADFAAETAELSRTQVLQQAGISILAQANQGPQQVLSLLG